jgi:hypothetical protein
VTTFKTKRVPVTAGDHQPTWVSDPITLHVFRQGKPPPISLPLMHTHNNLCPVLTAVSSSSHCVFRRRNTSRRLSITTIHKHQLLTLYLATILERSHWLSCSYVAPHRCDSIQLGTSPSPATSGHPPAKLMTPRVLDSSTIPLWLDLHHR